MSVKVLIGGFERERKEIQDKIAALKARDGFLDLLLKEVRSAAGVKSRKRPGRKPGPKPKAEKKAEKKAGGKKRGACTVREGILKTVASGGAPMTSGEIIVGAVALSGGAIASVRTQINALAKAGDIEQVPYEGRGFKYVIAKAKPKAEPKKAAT